MERRDVGVMGYLMVSLNGVCVEGSSQGSCLFSSATLFIQPSAATCSTGYDPAYHVVFLYYTHPSCFPSARCSFPVDGLILGVAGREARLIDSLR